MKEIFYFNFGRSAFKYGLLSYNLNINKKILIPDFICSEMTNVLKELSIPYSFYKLNDNLHPDWDDLKKINTNECSAILMVHYFGNSQNIEKYDIYSKENNLLLIEDNAHGFGGTYKSIEMGRFGDFGISSPRKSINSRFGGILYKNKEFNKTIKIKRNNLDILSAITHLLKYKLIILKKIFKKTFKKRPSYENPFAFKDTTSGLFKLDFISLKLLNKTSLELLKNSRIEIYNDWKIFAAQKKLTPLYDSINEGSIPWCYPVYVSSEKERIDLLNWGWKCQLNIFTWPTLPNEIIQCNGSAYKRWKKLICFSTDPENSHIKKYI